MVAPLVHARLMSVDAIVVNYNAGESLLACVQSLLSGTIKPAVKVQDNASSDGSAEKLRSLYGNVPGLEILMNPQNLGFARAVNRAASMSQADYLLVINPDCTLSQDALQRMVEALEADPQAAIAAPAVRDIEGKIEKASLRRFPRPWNSFLTVTGLSRMGRRLPAFKGVVVEPANWPSVTSRVEAVSGACMLIRRSSFDEVGHFDEAYGLHCEDLDLMYRFSQSGWHCLLVPAAAAVHEQGVSSRSRPLWVHRQKHLGMARFFDKFQASDHAFPARWLVHAGIWLHFLFKLPWAILRK